MDSETRPDGLPGTDTSVGGAEQAWLDVHDLARRFKTSSRHIYRMADSGRMPWGMKFGQLRRWSRRAIEIWERDGCAPERLPNGARH